MYEEKLWAAPRLTNFTLTDKELDNLAAGDGNQNTNTAING